jgi:hypothetical protein
MRRFVFSVVALCSLLGQAASQHTREQQPWPSNWVTRSQTSDQKAETRLGWWGYGHRELHANGAIQELLEKVPKGTSCCSGVHSGECRISRIVTLGNARKVELDGMLCDISPTTKVVSLQRFSEAGYVVVCAARSNAIGNLRTCPTTYCIGGPDEM